MQLTLVYPDICYYTMIGRKKLVIHLSLKGLLRWEYLERAEQVDRIKKLILCKL